jgi:hypothetical protein
VAGVLEVHRDQLLDRRLVLDEQDVGGHGDDNKNITYFLCVFLLCHQLA